MAKHIKKALILYGAYLENDLINGENDKIQENKNYDQDIIDYLATVTNKRAYICRLLREDMQKNNFRTNCPKVENRED